jgi:hypothetical protein
MATVASHLIPIPALIVGLGLLLRGRSVSAVFAQFYRGARLRPLADAYSKPEGLFLVRLFGLFFVVFALYSIIRGT